MTVPQRAAAPPNRRVAGAGQTHLARPPAAAAPQQSCAHGRPAQGGVCRTAQSSRTGCMMVAFAETGPITGRGKMAAEVALYPLTVSAAVAAQREALERVRMHAPGYHRVRRGAIPEPIVQPPTHSETPYLDGVPTSP